MFADRETCSPMLNLNRRDDQPPFFVDLQAYFEFCFWMTEELLDLEAQFKPRRARGPLAWSVANINPLDSGSLTTPTE